MDPSTSRSNQLMDLSQNDTVHTNATTRVVLKTHKLRWRIENFSSVPLDVDVEGPHFCPTPYNECSIYLRKSDSYLDILIANTSESNLYAKCQTSILDINGNSLYNYFSVLSVDKDFETGLVGEHLEYKELVAKSATDVLIIECSFQTKEMNFAILTDDVNHLAAVGSKAKCFNHFSALMNDNLTSDVSFHVDNVILRCHWAVLCARSAYFRRLFENGAKEKTDGCIVITDEELPLFQELLKFIYTGESDLFRDVDRYVSMENEEDQRHNRGGGDQMTDLNTVFKMYQAAFKYKVTDLQKTCASVILSKMKVENACRILSWAEKYSDIDLKSRATHYVNENFDYISTSSSWKTFLVNHTRLASDIVNFCNQRARKRRYSDVHSENEK